MGYAGFSLKENSRALLPAGRRRVGANYSLKAEARNSSRASLTHFLIFCNKFSALIALAVGPQPIRVTQKYADPSVMAGLVPAIHAASAPFVSCLQFR
jgi:hypothetical protein